MAGQMIGVVVCEPPVVRAGDDVHVIVHDADGVPYDNADDGLITINGVVGSSQWLRFDSPGRKRLRVTARRGPRFERKHAEVKVSALAKGQSQRPSLWIERSLESPFELRFSVLGTGHRYGELALAGRHLTTTPRYRKLPFLANIRRAKLGLPRTRKPNRPPVPKRGGTLSRDGSLAEPYTYLWDFGDGSPSSSTSMPSASHDYSGVLGSKRQHHVLTVEVQLVRGGKTAHRLRQTVSLFDPYALMRSKAYLILPAQGADSVALGKATEWRGKISIRNFESQPIKLTLQRLEPFFADGRQSGPAVSTAVEATIPASPGGELLVHVKGIPKDAVSFAVHLAGTHGGRRVRTSAYFDIPERRLLLARRLDPSIASLIQSALEQELLANPKRATPAEIASLVSHGLLAPPDIKQRASVPGIIAAVAGLARGKSIGPMTPLSGHIAPTSAQVGETCDPHNLPAGIPEGLVCLPTSTWETVHMPARFMNAKKGDIVLSPYAEGLVGGILLELGQLYSHCGIMTRNHDEITNSTAHDTRLEDYPNGVWFEEDEPLDGFEPDQLKYLWPGAITQRVEDAVDGEHLTDPVSGDSYAFTTFNPDFSKAGGRGGKVVPALVVKPDPFLETPEIRERLSEIGDVAIEHEGKSHYRFYAYTDPTIAFGGSEFAPSDYDWAAGSWPSSCSSFVWRCVTEILPVPEAGTATPGLHLYSAAQRLAVGEFIHDYISDLVEKKADAAGVLEVLADLEDTADDCANQVCNTFASDWSDTDAKDSDEWKNTNQSFSVSPSDILSWDAPDNGSNSGLYGYAEPLIYRAPRDEFLPIYRWQQVATRGTLVGTTMYQGAPIGGVRVELMEGLFDVSDQNGHFEIHDVPTGTWIAEAYKTFQDGNFLNAPAEEITITAGETTTWILELLGPDPRYREVVVDGHMFGVDDEYAAAAYPIDWKDCFKVMHIGPDNAHAETKWSLTVDDSVMMHAKIALDLHPNDSVQVTLTANIHEDEDADSPIESERSASFNVEAGSTGSWHGMKVVNDNDDTCEVNFTVTNNIDIS